MKYSDLSSSYVLPGVLYSVLFLLTPLALILSNGVGTYDEENLSFLRAISEHERYRFDILSLGKSENVTSSLRLLKGLNSRVLPVETFSSHIFAGYLLDLIGSLKQSTTDHQS